MDVPRQTPTEPQDLAEILDVRDRTVAVRADTAVKNAADAALPPVAAPEEGWLNDIPLRRHQFEQVGVPTSRKKNQIRKPVGIAEEDNER
jgi:hypothetical protein